MMASSGWTSPGLSSALIFLSVVMTNSQNSTYANDIERCRGFIACCTVSLFGLVFFWKFPLGLGLYSIVQLLALSGVFRAGRLLNWGTPRVLLYVALAFIPIINWLALGDLHRSLGKQLRAEAPLAHASAKNDSSAVTGVVVVFAVVGIALALVFGSGSSSGKTNASSDTGPALQRPPGSVGTEALEAELGAMLTAFVAEQRQQIFNALHPTGTVTDSKVHEAKVTKWRKGVATNRPEDIAEFVVRYTIYWEGPVTRDGFTKIAQTYDAEVGRYIRSEILATNGITNEEAAQAAGFVFGAALRHAIENAATE